MKTLNIYLTVLHIALLPMIGQASNLQTSIPKTGTSKSFRTDAPDLTFLVQKKGIGKAVPTKLSAYRGRWMLLEFWNRYCANCIKAMPSLDTLAKQLSGKVDFLLIGSNDRHNQGIQQLYQRIRKLEHLDLDIAFDSISFRAFRIGATPRAILISPEGKIAYDGPEKPTRELLEKLSSGSGARTPATTATARYQKLTLDDQASAVPHRSRFGPWQQDTPLAQAGSLAPPYDLFIAKGMPLYRLFMAAYLGTPLINSTDSLYGKVAHKPIIESPDSIYLKGDFRNRNDIYDYQLSLSHDKGKMQLMQAMQQDLKKISGHVAVLEKRNTKALELVVTNRKKIQKLQADKNEFHQQGDPTGYVLLANTPKDIISLLAGFFQQQPIYDNTGISFAMDMELKANMTSLPSLRLALNSYGLDLRPAQRMLDVLVIRPSSK